MLKSTMIAKIIALLSVIILANLMTIESEAQQRKVLLEQHTGAWCGWCPDGTVVMDKLQEDYPGRVIGVKWHNGDAMVIPEQGQVAGTLGISGYPSGTVSRNVFNVGGQGAIGLSRNAWAGASTALLETEASVEVVIDNYVYDPATNSVVIDFTMNVLQDIPNQVVVNGFLCEDKVIGPNNSQWNQRNYMSNNPNFSSHPYYTQPDPIVGYEHNKVVRANFASNIFGDIEGLPATLSAGQSYEFTLSTPVPKVLGNQINFANTFVVAYASNFATNAAGQLTNVAILNADDYYPAAIDGSVTVEFSGTGNFRVVDPEETYDYTFKVTNTGSNEETFGVYFLGNMPNDWVGGLDKSEVTLAPGASENVTVTLTTTMNADDADFMVIASAESDPFIAANASFGVVSSNSKILYIEAVDSPDYSGVEGVLAATEWAQMSSITPANYLNNANRFNELELIIYSNGELGQPTADIASVLNNAFNSGVRIMIDGASWTNNGASNSFLNNLGVASTGTYFQNRQPDVGIKGVNGDPISNGWNTTIRLIQFLSHGYKVTNSSIAKATLEYSMNPDTLAAVRTETENSKAVLFGINLRSIVNADHKESLIRNAVEWLFAGAAPEISASTTNLNFEDVQQGGSKMLDLTVTNTGDADLIITEATFGGAEASSFSFVSGKISEPKTVLPGESYIFEIRFMPAKSGTHMANLNIISNAGDVKVTLLGTGETSVRDGFAGDDAIFSVTATPNPVQNAAQITYNVVGNNSKNVQISLVNAAGQTLAQLVNANIAPGIYTLNFDANAYSAGNYFIVANADDFRTQLPIVIVK